MDYGEIELEYRFYDPYSRCEETYVYAVDDTDEVRAEYIMDNYVSIPKDASEEYKKGAKAAIKELVERYVMDELFDDDWKEYKEWLEDRCREDARKEWSESDD